jgi:presqualene diphosphate synthase
MAIGPSPPARTAASPALPAARSSFYAALRILPLEQRQAMFEVYAFCRAVDDIADEGGERPERLAELARWRSDLANFYAHGSLAPRLASLAGPIRRFGLAQMDFDAILDGMVMDAQADIRAPDFATLDLYCDRVASAVGRHSVRIFGVPTAQARPLAHHLGRALQLTNVLRDIDEDAERGRLYLPREALHAAGITETEPMGVLAHPNFAAACAPLVEKAQSHFAQAAGIMRVCPRATTRSPRLMAAVYGSILSDLVSRGFFAPRRPVRVVKSRVLWAILRHGIL